MPFNGAGVFTRVYNWVADAAAAIPITAARVDGEDDGYATGLSNCICKDGQTTIIADLPMSGFKLTGVGNASARNQNAVVGQIQDSVYNWVAGGGTSDVITATYAPAVTALVDGMELDFRASAANATTTPTFSPNGVTAHTITKNGGSALGAGDIPAAAFEGKLRYNLANTRWELMNPAVTSQAPFLDTNALVKGSSDATKLLRFEVDGLTTGTTRTLTPQDKNYTIADNADVLLKAPLASPALTGSPTAPTQTANDNSTKIATTAYVDAKATFSKGNTITMNPFVTNSVISGAHGLGSTPNSHFAYFECLTGELGYSAGNRVSINSNVINAGGRIAFWADATNSGASTDSVSLPIFNNKAGGSPSAITAANWKLIIVPILM